MNAVIDTNIFVSGILSPKGNAGYIINALLSGHVTLCYDSRILKEYDEVLHREKYKFASQKVDLIIDAIRHSGFSVNPRPLPDVPFGDETDRPFYEVAVHCDTYLVTGNIRHYPKAERVMSLKDFYWHLYASLQS